MDDDHGTLASGNTYRVTPYLLEVRDPAGAVLITVDAQTITSLARVAQTVTLRLRGREPITLACASLDDAGRIETILRPAVSARQASAKPQSGLRYVVAVIALASMLIILTQACAASVAGSLDKDQRTSDASGAGVIVALCYIVGAGFALAKPRIALGAFVLAAVIAVPTGATSAFSDLIVWGVIAAVLAGLCWCVHHGRVKAQLAG